MQKAAAKAAEKAAAAMLGGKGAKGMGPWGKGKGNKGKGGKGSTVEGLKGLKGLKGVALLPKLRPKLLVAPRRPRKALVRLRTGPHPTLSMRASRQIHRSALFAGLLQWLPEGPMMGGLGSTKFGYESSQMMDLQMAGGLFYFGSMLGLVAWTGSEAQHLLACKSLTITWAVCSAIFWFGTLNGAAFTESNVLAPIMTLVYAYLGFA